MTAFHDSVLGEFKVEVVGETAMWECTPMTPAGELTCFLDGSLDAPSEAQVECLREVVPQMATLFSAAVTAIAQQLQDDPTKLEANIEDNIDVPYWLALSSDEFRSRFEMMQASFTADNQFMLVLISELEEEHGLGVVFEGLSAVRVTTGDEF